MCERRYLSFGGGVNSTALLLLLTEEGVEFEAVFVDHGGDYPETYEYVAMLQEREYSITVLQPDAEGYSDLYDYSMAKGIVPYRTMRWCTGKFKQEPMYRYFETPCHAYIGIDADEERRAADSRRAGITNVFPLVERGIGRQDCIDIIKKRRLPVPPKSGCWFCPYTPRTEWVRLRNERPDLWCKAVALEANAVAAQTERGGDPEAAYLCKRPLEDLVRAKDARGRYVVDDQLDLFDDRKPCQCGL